MKYTLLIITLFVASICFSQEVVKDSIGTEEVNIVKPYTPKIKDAFKVKSNPVQGNDAIQEKKPVNYSINSAPVASTFVPSKGKAKGVARKKRENLFDNYVSLGFGNYTTPKAEVFVHSSSTRNNDFGALLNYYSSKNGVKDAKLNTNFTDAKIDLFYKDMQRDYDWKVNGGYHYQQYNWYGLPDNNLLSDVQIAAINPKQNYGTINLGTDLIYYDSFFKGVNLDLNLFNDGYKSFETHIIAKPKLEFPVSNELIATNFRLEYIAGKFNTDYSNTETIKYGYYNLGISPNLRILRDYFTINLGANLVYSGATQSHENSKFLIYPNITASYELIQDVMVIYAGLTGDVKQNSYRNFVKVNPFVSPTLNMRRTSEMYNAKIGMKGKLITNVSYNVNASYKKEESKPLFKLNNDLYIGLLTEINNYQYANSFNVVYDNVNTLGVFGEINVDLSKEFRLSATVNFDSYNTEFEDKAWNLPNLQTSIIAAYTAKKFSAGANLFYVGERKDLYSSSFGIVQTQTKITNKSYIDLNLNIGYNFTDRLSAFAEVNNVLNTDYQKYTNFKVQGIQFLGGVKYKFDF